MVSLLDKSINKIITDDDPLEPVQESHDDPVVDEDLEVSDDEEETILMT